MSDARQWKVGDFAMQRGFPVRIRELEPGLTTEGVCRYPNGYWGSSACLGGSPSELGPIPDAETWLLCQAYDAQRLAAAAKAEATKQEADCRTFLAAMDALRKARDAHPETGAAQ